MVYLTDMNKKAEMDAVWCDWIPADGIVMYGRPRCCKGETDLKRRQSLQSCIRLYSCGALTAGPDGIRKIDAQSH